MLREMEELRSLGIGSPVPTPRSEDEPVFDNLDPSDLVDPDARFPAIRVESCWNTDGKDSASRSRSKEVDPVRPPVENVIQGGAAVHKTAAAGT